MLRRGDRVRFREDALAFARTGLSMNNFISEYPIAFRAENIVERIDGAHGVRIQGFPSYLFDFSCFTKVGFSVGDEVRIVASITDMHDFDIDTTTFGLDYRDMSYEVQETHSDRVLLTVGTQQWWFRNDFVQAANTTIEIGDTVRVLNTQALVEVNIIVSDMMSQHPEIFTREYIVIPSVHTQHRATRLSLEGLPYSFLPTSFQLVRKGHAAAQAQPEEEGDNLAKFKVGEQVQILANSEFLRKTWLSHADLDSQRKNWRKETFTITNTADDNNIRIDKINFSFHPSALMRISDKKKIAKKEVPKVITAEYIRSLEAQEAYTDFYKTQYEGEIMKFYKICTDFSYSYLALAKALKDRLKVLFKGAKQPVINTYEDGQNHCCLFLENKEELENSVKEIKEYKKVYDKFAQYLNPKYFQEIEAKCQVYIERMHNILFEVKPFRHLLEESFVIFQNLEKMLNDLQQAKKEDKLSLVKMQTTLPELQKLEDGLNDKLTQLNLIYKEDFECLQIPANQEKLQQRLHKLRGNIKKEDQGTYRILIEDLNNQGELIHIYKNAKYICKSYEKIRRPNTKNNVGQA